MASNKSFTKQCTRMRATDWLLSFGAPLVMLFLLEGFSRNDVGAVLGWLWRAPLLFLCNYLLMLSVCLMLSALRSDRLRAALTVLLCLLCALLGIANHYKMLYRLEPLLLTDITQMGEAMNVLTGMDFDIDVVLIAMVCAVGVALMVLCCVFLKGKQAKRPVLAPVAGLLWLCLALPLMTFGLMGSEMNTDMVDHARNDGTLYAMIAMENHRKALMRVDYNEADVRKSYGELMKAAQEEGTIADMRERPNVIVVLWESFCDENWLGQYINLTQTIMPYYQQLCNESATGRIYVPKAGGGTSETEFEVLTGLKSKYSYNPYSMGLPPMNSLASILREKGYESTAIHWNPGVYYNRYKNLKMEGFQSFYSTDTTTTAFQKCGAYISDQEHFDSIVDRLQETEKRDFVFCLTMQNHGGYGYDDFRETYGAAVPFSDKLSAESERILTNYCWLLSQSDKALESFIEQLRGLDEPTMVLLYGDHIPPFGTDVMEEVGIPVQGEESHLTPYLIWSNSHALAGVEDMYAYQLGAYTLTLAGLNDDPFLSYIERNRKAGTNADDCYDLLCYDALFGKQYAYEEGGLSPVDKNFQIGGEMRVSSFDVIELGGELYVKPRLAQKDQAYKLRVNGKLQSGMKIDKTDAPLTLQCVMTYDNDRRIFNESNIMSYANTDELLKQSGKVETAETPLWNSGYIFTQNQPMRDFYVFRSEEPYWQQGETVVLFGDEPMQRQSGYDVTAAGQYGVDGSGYIFFAVQKIKMEGFELCSEGFQAYLKQENARIIRLPD